MASLLLVPDKVTEIGRAAFANCSNLFSITIPEGVTKILENAFSNCGSLPSISIPDSVTEIGNGAFENCRNLTSITIPTAFHNESEARRLSLFSIWPQGFLLPPTKSSEPAEAKAILVNGFVVGIEIENGMGGYVVPPEITISGGGGSGATGVSILDNGVVVGVEITNTGRGYSSPPTITIAPPPVPEPQIAIRLVPAVTVTGESGQTAVIEISDSADGPWFEWRNIEIEGNKTIEFDLDEGPHFRAIKGVVTLKARAPEG